MLAARATAPHRSDDAAADARGRATAAPARHRATRLRRTCRRSGARSASIAASSSSPSVSISTSLPMPGGQHHHAHDALGIDAPAVAAQEDLAAESSPASLVSLADARACRPSLLLILTVALIMAAA